MDARLEKFLNFFAKCVCVFCNAKKMVCAFFSESGRCRSERQARSQVLKILHGEHAVGVVAHQRGQEAHAHAAQLVGQLGVGSVPQQV